MKSVVIDKMMRSILLAHIFKDCLETKISNNNNNNEKKKQIAELQIFPYFDSSKIDY